MRREIREKCKGVAQKDSSPDEALVSLNDERVRHVQNAKVYDILSRGERTRASVSKVKL